MTKELQAALDAVAEPSSYTTPPSDGWEEVVTEAVNGVEVGNTYGQEDVILKLDGMISDYNAGGLWRARDWIVAEAMKIRESRR